MARNVGSIEITVDANTGKLRAQILPVAKKVGDEAGDALSRGLSDIDTTALKAKIAKLGAQIERELESIDPELHIDTGAARAEIERLRGQLAAIEDEDIRVEVNVEMDDALADAQFEAIRQRWEDEDIAIEVDLDSAQASVELNSWLREQGAKGLDTDIELGIAQATAAFDAWISRQEERGIDVEVDADTVRATLQFKQWVARMSKESIDTDIDLNTAKAHAELSKFMAKHGNIDVDVDLDIERARAAFDAWITRQSEKGIDTDVDLDTLRATLDFEQWVERMSAKDIETEVTVKEGGAGGAGGGGGGIAGLLSKWRLILAGAAVSMADQLGVLLQGTLSAATSLASSAFSALGGAAGAAAPLIAALGASVATLVVGFQGMGGALKAVGAEFTAATAEGRAFNINAEDIAAAMKGLAPAAQDVVRAFADIHPQLDSIRRSVQGRLFAGMGDELRDLASTALPTVGRGLSAIATSFNSFFKDISGQVKGMDIAGIFQGLKPVVDNVLRALSNVFGSIEPFLKAAAPAAQALTAALAEGAKALTGMVKAGEASGGLRDFLMEGVQSLKEWGSLLAATGRALFTLFQAGKASGDSFIGSLTAIVNKFNEWMKMNPAALEAFFDSGKAAMSALVPILKGLQGMFTNLIDGGAISRFADFASAIGNVLPVLGKLLNVVGQLSILNLLAQALEAIATAIDPIMPALQALANMLGKALGQAITALGPLLMSVAQSLGRLAQTITPLVPSIAKLATALIKAFTPLIAANIEMIVTMAEAMVPAFKLVIGAVTVLATVFGKITPVIAAVMGAFSDFTGLIGDAFGAVIDKIGEFLDLLSSVPVLGDVLDFIGITDGADDAAAAMGAAGESGGMFGRAMTDAGDAMRGAAGDADGAAGSMEALPPTLADIAAAAGMSTDSFAKFEEAMAGASDAVFGIQGPMTNVERAMLGVGQAAEDAAGKADAFREALDVLVSPKLDVAGALSDYKQGIDDLGKALEENGRSTDLNTEKGRTNAEQIRSQIEAIGAWGEAALASGTKQEDVTTIMEGIRAALVEQVGAFDLAGMSAEDYIAQLGLTPESIKTAVETPGLLKASADILAYDFDLDGIADNKDTTFSQSNLGVVRQRLTEYGLDLTNTPDTVLTAFLQENWERVHGQTGELAAGMQAITDNPAVATVTETGVVPTTTAVEGVGTAVDTVDGKTATVTAEVYNNLVVLAVLSAIETQMKAIDKLKASPSIAIPTSTTVLGQIAAVIVLMGALNNTKAAPQVTLPTFATVVGQIAVMMAFMQRLNATSAAPDVRLDNYGQVIAQIAGISIALGALNRYTATPSVTIGGYQNAINQIHNIQSALDGLRDKTVTLRTNTVNTTTQAMAGAMIGHQQQVTVGERGLSEAIIPLQLPLNRVNPEVRAMAELIRGGGSPTPIRAGAGKVVNNYMQITTAADPVAAATQIINRSAVLANR